jgi:hypothetical protein
MKLPLLLAMSLVLAYLPTEARTKRSQSAIVEFKQQHPCPANGATKGPCKGYVIDDAKAIACGVLTHPAICSGRPVLMPRLKTSGSVRSVGSRRNPPPQRNHVLTYKLRHIQTSSPGRKLPRFRTFLGHRQQKNT